MSLVKLSGLKEPPSPDLLPSPEPKRRFLNESRKKRDLAESDFQISRIISSVGVKADPKPDLETSLYMRRSPIFLDHRFCPPTQFREIREET